MIGRNAVSDKQLLKSVNQRLSRTGSQSNVKAIVRQGVVTLTGKLRYANQRLPIVKAAKSVAGVRQVLDQLQAPPSTKPHGA